MYLPHFGVHGPHEAKADLIARFEKKIGQTNPDGEGHDDPTYAAMIASVDESVGRILKTLDALKLSDNTVVIFASDNGGKTRSGRCTLTPQRRSRVYEIPRSGLTGETSESKFGH